MKGIWLKSGLLPCRADEFGLAATPAISVDETEERQFVLMIHARNSRNQQSRVFFHGFTVSFFGALAQGWAAGGLEAAYPRVCFVWPAARRLLSRHYRRAQNNLTASVPAARNFIEHMQARVSSLLAHMP